MKNTMNQYKGLLWGTIVCAICLSVVSQSYAAAGETIRIGVPKQSASFLMMLADEQGLFAKEGLKVAVKEYPTGKHALNDGLLAGQADVISTAEVPVVFSSFTRKDFAILSVIGTSSNYARIIARTSSGIKQPKDLRGKRIATQKGSVIHFFLSLYLMKQGISEKNVTMSFMNFVDLPKALADGKVDAISTNSIQIKPAKTSLGDNAIAVFSQPGLYTAADVVVASSKFVQSNPEAVKSILKALVKAEDFARKHPSDAIKILAKRMGENQDQVAAEWPDYTYKVQLPQFLLLALEDEARWVVKNKILDATSIPNYMDFIYLNGLKSVRPGSVSIIK